MLSGHLFVCVTCDRYANAEPDGRTRGRALLALVLARAKARPTFAVRAVECLNGCPKPCNVSLRGLGKWHFRFSQIGPDDVDALAALAEIYQASADGSIADADWSDGLRRKLSIRTPPRIMAQAATAGPSNSADACPA